jgi:hypothetical protein
VAHSNIKRADTQPLETERGIGMAGYSFAIIAVIIVMDVMFMRRGKRAAVIISLPLISVPLFYLLGVAIGSGLPWFPARDALAPGMIVAGLLVGIAGCAAVTRLINTRKVKTIYFTVGAVYLVLLTVGYLMRLH